MKMQLALSGSYMALVVLLTVIQLSASKSSTPLESLHLQQEEQLEWREVINLYEQGLNEYQKENRTKEKNHRRSEAIFNNASNKLALYINKYIKDVNSLKYLRAMFRLGTYWEYANKDEQALRSYLVCENHSLINDVGSLFNNQRLAPLVKTRIKEVQKRLNRSSTGNSQVSGNRIITRSSKGGSKGEGKKRDLPPLFEDSEL